MKKIVQTAGRNQLGDFAPNFAHFNDDVLFGENWNNQDIDLKTRSIITFVALMSSGITDSSLTYHLQNAKANGVTKAEAAAIITHTAFYVGWPKGWALFKLAMEVWNDKSTADDEKAKHGQILICVAGHGYYQELGKKAIEMNPGDCINIPAGVKHWHGAASDSWFSHLAVDVPGVECSTEWLEAVSDEEYNKFK